MQAYSGRYNGGRRSAAHDEQSCANGSISQLSATVHPPDEHLERADCGAHVALQAASHEMQASLYPVSDPSKTRLVAPTRQRISTQR